MSVDQTEQPWTYSVYVTDVPTGLLISNMLPALTLIVVALYLSNQHHTTCHIQADSHSTDLRAHHEQRHQKLLPSSTPVTLPVLMALRSNDLNKWPQNLQYLLTCLLFGAHFTS